MSLTALARPPIPAKANHHTGFAQRVSLSSQPNPTFLTSVCPLRARPDIFVHEDRQLLMGPPDSPPPLDAHFHLQSGLSAFGVSPAIRTDTFLTAKPRISPHAFGFRPDHRHHANSSTHWPRAARSPCCAFLSLAPSSCPRCILQPPGMTLFDAQALCTCLRESETCTAT